MKLVLISTFPDAPCTKFYKEALQYLDDFSFSGSIAGENFDVGLFMTYPDDLRELLKSKKKYPKLITAIVDPRGDWVKPYLEYADFLIVDSLEMRDYWSYSNLPIFEYAEFPNIPVISRNQVEINDRIVLGYHGNKVHLECMKQTVTPVLEKLSKSFDIELRVMYNIAQHGKWKYGVPRIDVKHIQWSMDNYHTYLADVHIGLVPCFIPENPIVKFFESNTLRSFNRFGKSKNDYLLRFKMPTNPGRIIVWGLLNVPVVADFFPSAMQVIEEKKSGLLACSSGGWYNAILQYINNSELRKICADNLSNSVREKFLFSKQNVNLLCFLRDTFGLL